jgi:hypothetical protein
MSEVEGRNMDFVQRKMHILGLISRLAQELSTISNSQSMEKERG